MATRTNVAISVTSIWIAVGAIHFMVYPEIYAGLSPNEWGDTLAGFFAPLAFLWIIVAYLQQGDELRQNTEALRLQEKELAAQVKETRRHVETAQERLELERERRLEAQEARKQEIQPVFEPRGGRGRGGGGMTMDVRNTGGDALDISVEIDGKSLNVKGGDYVRGGSEFKVSVPGGHEGEILSISYVDQEGDQQVQKFEYNGHAGFKPLVEDQI